MPVKYLESSVVDSQGGRVFTIGVGSENMQECYRLFSGTVCSDCIAVFCVDCAGQPLDKCPQCGRTTTPAFHHHLLELRRLAGARRVP